MSKGDLGRLIGRTKGGMNTKLHALADANGRPLSFFLTAGQVSDYPGDLVLVTKVGAVRGEDASWNLVASPDELRRAVEDNLRNLGVDRLEVVNFRSMPGGGTGGPTEGSIAEPFEALAADGIAFVPFFPLGGFSPLQSGELSDVAQRLGATPMQVALAWLLRRSPNILLIPSTSSVAHLRENMAAGVLELPDDAVAALNGIGR